MNSVLRRAKSGVFSEKSRKIGLQGGSPLASSPASLAASRWCSTSSGLSHRIHRYGECSIHQNLHHESLDDDDGRMLAISGSRIKGVEKKC